MILVLIILIYKIILQSNELSASNNIFVRDNFIETRNINSDFTFSASGTGKIATTSPVSISLNINVDNNMSFIGNLSGDDILSVTNLSAASTFNAEIFDISNQIVIQDNFITTTESNSDLDLRANGTGSTIIKLRNCKYKYNWNNFRRFTI